MPPKNRPMEITMDILASGPKTKNSTGCLPIEGESPMDACPQAVFMDSGKVAKNAKPTPCHEARLGMVEDGLHWQRLPLLSILQAVVHDLWNFGLSSDEVSAHSTFDMGHQVSTPGHDGKGALTLSLYGNGKVAKTEQFKKRILAEIHIPDHVTSAIPVQCESLDGNNKARLDDNSGNSGKVADPTKIFSGGEFQVIHGLGCTGHVGNLARLYLVIKGVTNDRTSLSAG